MSLDHEQSIVDQQMTSLTHEADIANLTSVLDQSLSIIEDPSEAGNSFQLNFVKKTPVSIEWEVSQKMELIESVSTDEPPYPNISRDIRDRIRREIEMLEQIAERLTRNFERERNIRAKETPEQTFERQTVQAQLQRERRANETNDVKDAERQKNKSANETPAQCAERLQKNRDYYARQKENETPQQRMDRLGLNYEQRREQRHNLATHMLWSIPRHTVVVTDDQGELNNVCEFCKAPFWNGERNSAGIYTKCCERNKIMVPQFDRIHPTLDRWTNAAIRTGRDLVDSNDFLTNIRQYNSLFAMCTVISNFDPQDLDNRGNDQRRLNARRNFRLPFLYKVHGAMYYRMQPMFNGPNGVMRTRAAQYLMMDSDRSIFDHMRRNWAQDHGDVSEKVIQLLNEMLRQSNSLVQLFRNNREILAYQNARDPMRIGMWMTRFVPGNTNVPINAKGRRQIIDAAVNGEVAAVFNDQDGLPADGIIMYAEARQQQLNLINIVPQTVNNHMQSIDMRSPNCDPLCFPLLFPYGEAGYDERYEHNQAVHPRDGLPNEIFRMSKLFQEYIVSAWMKIEKNNLQFLRTHQNQLRILDYQGVMERLNQPNFNPNEPIDQSDEEHENENYEVQLNRPDNINRESVSNDEDAVNVALNEAENNVNANGNNENNNTDVNGVNLNNVPDDDVNQLNNPVVYD
ncbi:hypothetical protein BpHYR1_007527 [Brachionus plicatilis]|uniref:Helitron helicase-like domain-containing protein n=1 Tax=Brachionus plicatilis TaxID=10195 RepID=A0A3M7PT65_BRAPC|nr:hypothetical protein BpHYR1_007527 [Brachionus plicatilis]